MTFRYIICIIYYKPCTINWFRRMSVFSLSIRSVLTFTDASEEDLGLYLVEKSDEPELSSSYDFTAEGKRDCAKLMCPWLKKLQSLIFILK